MWATLIAALIGFAAVYVTLGRPDNAERGAERRSVTASPPAAGESGKGLPSGPGANPLSRGDMAAFVFHKAPQAVPEVTFEDAAGKTRSLADWRGKVVLVNLWATWCLPCRKEMPALARLQKELGSDKFEVVAVSVDRTGVPGAEKFLKENGAAGLAVYADAGARMAASLRAAGLPATLLLDRDGKEIGRLLGPAEWDGEDAKRLIRAALQ